MKFLLFLLAMFDIAYLHGPKKTSYETGTVLVAV
jgi:hypothetical protein